MSDRDPFSRVEDVTGQLADVTDPSAGLAVDVVDAEDDAASVPVN